MFVTGIIHTRDIPYTVIFTRTDKTMVWNNINRNSKLNLFISIQLLNFDYKLQLQ